MANRYNKSTEKALNEAIDTETKVVYSSFTNLELMKEVFTPKEAGTKSALVKRSRRLAYTALAGGALLLTACGGDPNNNNPDGGAGAGGSGGIDGGAGAGGEAGGDPCKDLPFDGLGSKVFQPGETGMIKLTGLQGAEAAYNNIDIEVVSGEIFTKPTMLGVEIYKVDNAPAGYGIVRNNEGITVYPLDPYQPRVSDGNNNCKRNYRDINQTAMADPAKQPLLHLKDRWTTVFNVRGDVSEKLEYDLNTDGTTAKLNAFSSDSGDVAHFSGNALPGGGNPNIYINPDGTLGLDGTNVTDEDKNSDLVLNSLNPTVNGYTFQSVSPGIFKTQEQFTGQSPVTVSWSGLNAELTNDTVTKLLNVEPPPNNPPVINSLLANPNPVLSYSTSTISFNITEPDNDPVNWSLNMTDKGGPVDELVNPSSGSCTGLTCSGTLLAGGGAVTVTYNSGTGGTSTMILDADDGKNLTDQDQENVQTN